MRFVRTSLALAAVGALLAAAVSSGAAAAPRTSSDPEVSWAPAATAAVHPGIMTYTGGSQCTANFVFTRLGQAYLGQAAHCAGTGGNTATDGCTSSTLGVGADVEDLNGNHLGTIAYSSWVSMQNEAETDPDLCAYNDFALIKLDTGTGGTQNWVSQTNPTVPIYGGPDGLNTAGIATLDDVYAIGNTSLRLGVSQLMNHHGYSIGELGSGRAHQVYTIGPGIPGDSGGPLLDSSGNAAGVLSTVGLYPFALSNNFADLDKAMEYAKTHGMSGLTLVKGDTAFTPVLVAP